MDKRPPTYSSTQQADGAAQGAVQDAAQSAPSTRSQAAFQVRYTQCFATWCAYFGEHPRLLTLLVGTNKAITWLFYGAYGLLLVFMLLADPRTLIGLVLVPGAGFVLVSWARARYNAPRPATACHITPLVAREGEGKSFPSRHMFSAATIATLWFVASTPIAVLLWICALALGACRVLGGVHFVRDVVAGAACGLTCGLISCAVCALL